ncbi:nuclear transport factor 2 family protein [Pseudoxanthomonas sp. UTMC 1351]|uniref:nuclear transport factor 2 family protein n=1 Tax=Pseudoxanthomonas sp. UTMC 1351 TaxID=2695853 RepID=UPI0034CD97E4
MRYAVWLSVSLLLVSQLAMARDTTQDEREILRVEAALCDAFEAGNATALRRYLDETFTLTDSRGTVTDFAQNVAEVERREPRYEVFRNHSQKVRLYGDAAITTGITAVKGRANGAPFAADFQFTDTWVYRDGGWKMVASHASRLESKAPE